MPLFSVYIRCHVFSRNNAVSTIVLEVNVLYPHVSAGTDRIGVFVLDEADEMLSRGFKDQIYDVFRLLPNDVQVRCIY